MPHSKQIKYGINKGNVSGITVLDTTDGYVQTITLTGDIGLSIINQQANSSFQILGSASGSARIITTPASWKDLRTGLTSQTITISSGNSVLIYLYYDGTNWYYYSSIQSNTLVVLRPPQNEPPISNFATLDTRNNRPVLDFDATTNESAVFMSALPLIYNGNGLNIDLYWSAETATSGNVVWQIEFERIKEGIDDIDTDSFATGKTATGTANATSGILTKTSISFSSSEIDSLLANECFRIRITRLANDVGDTMTGDAELLVLLIRD